MTRSTTGIRARNVNHALDIAVGMTLDAAEDSRQWRRTAPRGMPTIEFRGLMVTDYEKPMERVLFSSTRDANPFFHFFEALWILDGRDDVEYLAQFNANMRNFSDDGVKFHAPYGQRLRRHFIRGQVKMSGHTDYNAVDQFEEIILLLRREPDTRRAVMCIWDPAMDLNVQSKDLPCNDLIMMGLDDNTLNMEVVCRSNDVIWGAYGANAVQFSFIQEFIARAIGAEIGQLSQISRSFHFYLENPTLKKLQDGARQGGLLIDAYDTGQVKPYPIMADVDRQDYWREWRYQLQDFLESGLLPTKEVDPFFEEVAFPMYRAWVCYKNPEMRKSQRIEAALRWCERIKASDWRLACECWLARREVKGEAV